MRAQAATPSQPPYPTCPRALRRQDILMVSAFAVWAAILGLSPVMLFRAFSGS